MSGMMKSISKREFYRDPSLPHALRSGQGLVVTDFGELSFVVMKPGRPPQPTTAELAALAAKLLPGKRRTFNTVQLLRELRA